MMLTGWFTNSYGDLYYMNPVSDNTLGRMFTGWHYIDGYWYYFEEKDETRLGALSRNKTTPDGSKVNDRGQLLAGDIPVTDSKAKTSGK